MSEHEYVYIQSESNLLTVGFYDPMGNWHAESDHSNREEAAARVHYLNGGVDDINLKLMDAAPKLLRACQGALGALNALKAIGADKHLPGYEPYLRDLKAAIAAAGGE